jgi:transcriptional regulator
MPSVVPGRGNCRGTRCGGRKRVLNAEQDLEAVELRDAGLSYPAIARELGCSKEAAKAGVKRGKAAMQ